MAILRRFQLSSLSAAAIVAVSPLTGCSTNPATGRSQLNLLSREQTIALGEEAKNELAAQYGGPVPDPYLQQYVTEIGQRLAAETEADYPGLPWEFTLLDSDVINAFALPGGKVYITRGLASRLDNEAQLAGILGHEVGHVTAEHANQRIAGQLGLSLAIFGASVAAGASDQQWIQQAAPVVVGLGGQGFLLSFGRNEELEADALGMRYMSNIGYNPHAQLQVMEILGEASGGPSTPEFLSTHPHPQTRIDRINRLLKDKYPNAASNPDSGTFAERYQREFLSRLNQTSAPAGAQGALELSEEQRAFSERWSKYGAPAAAHWCIDCPPGASIGPSVH